MFSLTGVIPCQLCPKHSFSIAPIIGGYRECKPCPEVFKLQFFLFKIYYFRAHTQQGLVQLVLTNANFHAKQAIFLQQGLNHVHHVQQISINQILVNKNVFNALIIQ